jgi:hypothetical protein
MYIWILIVRTKRGIRVNKSLIFKLLYSFNGTKKGYSDSRIEILCSK